MDTPTTQALSVPTVQVSFSTREGQKRLAFTKSFRIGRLDDCDVSIENEYVGRIHAEIVFENDQWWLRDLNSRNGIYINDRRIERIAITRPIKVRLGKVGPEITLESDSPAHPAQGELTSRYIEHYFGNTGTRTPLGERTMRVRRAFAQVQKLQKLKHRRVVSALLIAILAVGSYALYQSVQIRRQRTIAKELFYSIKSLDIDVSNMERASTNPRNAEAIRSYESRRRDLENSYDRFLASLHIYDPKMPEQHRIILRVARIFGECELEMPEGFEAEVIKYIDLWRSSGRLVSALHTAKTNHYAGTISRELLAKGLPPQFFYLALQESNFNPMATGPVTRFGVAKGMWQFMPNTALAYGLKLGPLVEVRQPDALDERHQFAKETKAAASYLKDLYSTDAQASGFLVMASYNWGENRVIPLIRSMPANPRERNFWQLFSHHRDQIPRETYDYVFYIVSAAVIGENPRIFGFDFDNPLAEFYK